MFLNNKYTDWYYNIINARRITPVLGYGEKHHIIPHALGGDNSTSNIVKLTAREHWICHQLLTRMTVGIDRMRMLHPCLLFKRQCTSSKRYEQLKIERSKMMLGYKHSEDTKLKIAKSNIGKNAGRKHTAESKAKLSKALTGMQKPAGFGFGRTHDEETKIKISKGNLGKNCGRIYSQQTRDKLSASLLGLKKPDGFGAKISAARSIPLTIQTPDGSIINITVGKKQWAIENGLRLQSLIEKSKAGLAYKGFFVIDFGTSS